MEKCEKEERFEEAAIARDRILKLKKIENKKVLQELEIKQQESLYELDQLQSEELTRFDEELNEQEKRIKDEKEKCRLLLENKHFTEKQGLFESFEAKYPSQPKFSPEVLNLQKVMEGHIKNKEYEKANEIKIKILDLCEEQDMKHKIDMKNRKLEVELNKLKLKQNNEMNNLLSKWDTTLFTFLKKENISRDKLILKYQNKFKELQKKHNLQRIEQERRNKKNLVFKSNRLSHLVHKKINESHNITNNQIQENYDDHDHELNVKVEDDKIEYDNENQKDNNEEEGNEEEGENEEEEEEEEEEVEEK